MYDDESFNWCQWNYLQNVIFGRIYPFHRNLKKKRNLAFFPEEKNQKQTS